MKERLKKSFALFLCVIMCFSLLPEVRVYAEDATREEPAPMADVQGTAEGNLLINEENFPDDNFRSYISTNFDTDNQGYLTVEQVAGVKTISCVNMSIASLKGVEYFTALTRLECNLNQLTELDVSGNPALTVLNCAFNSLSELDVSGNPALKELNCVFNALSGLDVSKNPALEYLDCDYNEIAALDVSSNPVLTSLSCGENLLNTLNLSKNPVLTYLNCSNCQLTELNLSNNTALKALYCNFNQLPALDVSKLPALEVLDCSSNELTELNLSGNPALLYFNCGNNQLPALDLSCCTKLEEVNCTSNQLTELKVSGLSALTSLHCDNNQLTELDVSSSTKLTEFFCWSNLLTTLDVSHNPELTVLDCAYNELSELDVSKNPALYELYCSNNQLTELDLRDNPLLTSLYCWKNQLTALDVSQNPELTELDCAYNRLAVLDLSNNMNLQYVAFGGQSVSVWQFTQSDGKYTVDLSAVVGAENIGKIAQVDNGDYDPETGIASFDKLCNFTYDYGTGYGDAHMGVYCSIGITSFEQLKQLAALEYADWTDVYYVGTETFVFEEDLVLPDNLFFSTQGQDILIPAGVTVTANCNVNCSTLTVEGTLIAYAEVTVDNVNVSGSAEMYAPISLGYSGSISGEENVRFYPSEAYEQCGFNIHCNVTSYGMFEEILSEAGTNKPDRYYDLRMHIGDTLTIDKTIVIGGNTRIYLFDPVVIAENGMLEIDYFAQVSADVQINGTLKNKGIISVFAYSGWGFEDTELILGETGTYSGGGEMEVFSDSGRTLEEILPGFDLTEFDVVEEGEGDWTLTPKTIPGDANGDGKVNTMDLIRLMKSINGEEVDMAEGAGDMNGDGKINTMDLIRLMKYINGEDVELQ